MPVPTVTVRTDEHPAQEAFVNDQNDQTAYVGGVGSGKTAGGCLRVGRHISDWNEGYAGVIVCPTVPMLRNVVIPELREWGLLDKPGVEHHRSENRIEYANGSTIILESANNDRKIERLRGLNLAWAWMDEAAYLPEKVYTILRDRLRIGDYRNLTLTTTPRGFNWVYQEFGELDGGRESVADGDLVRTETKTAITGVSTATNPGNPQDYVESRKRQHTGQSYQQEVQGEFVRFQGLIYEWFDDDHLTDELPDPSALDEVIYGVDWGYHNPALVALGRIGDRWVVLEDYLGTETTVTDHLDQAKDMQDRWLSGPFYCDPAEPSNIEQFKRAGLNARAAENDVLPGIQHVTAMRDQLQIHESCQYLINEFRQYRWKEDGDDMTDAPVKENDHLCDSTRYALFTHQSGPDTETIRRRGGTRSPNQR